MVRVHRRAPNAHGMPRFSYVVYLALCVIMGYVVSPNDGALVRMQSFWLLRLAMRYPLYSCHGRLEKR
jgi:hypothetical protein